MKGCIWLIIHGCALVFFFPALLVTIPLHLISYQIEKRREEE